MNLKSKGLAVVSVLSGGFIAAPAFAADDMSTAVVTAISGVNPQIIAVVGAVAGALVLIVAWQLIKKAMH
ncbi:major capsid protein [Dyella jiangningensis]|uniref:Methyltransferase n=1 Tax=Dyella jiangningensis TaxID=1379159 RepID=A0A328P7W9_9GAMM|nr:major capsid protein [Dyella jiangningensis]RAO78189.1 hypothetical protein CA260_10310 [Dyella jiangningensis]